MAIRRYSEFGKDDFRRILGEKENKILQLEKQVERLKKSIRAESEKYGLGFVEVPEAFEDDVENKLPIVESVPELDIKSKDGKPTHLLIEGENYHALTCLNYTHKEKIDVIYIDPPYNTGSDGFRYKDKRTFDKYPDGAEVPTEHPLRHSYWLSFMRKRLELAKDLLSDKGVIFISIDDNEFAQLKLFCDSIFGENNVEVMIWKKIGDGDAGAGRMKITYRFRIEHEYIIVCYKNKETVRFSKTKGLPQFKNEYGNPDNDPRGPYKAGNISKTEDKSIPTGKNYYTVVSPSGKQFTRQWHFDKETFVQHDKDGRIYWGKKGDAVPARKIFTNEEKEITPTSIIEGKGSATSANKAIEKMFGERVFDNPKPLGLIKYLLEISSEQDAVILDFFAGSGTTGEAVMELNADAEDKGKRQFILVTDNERKIMSDVCYPRIKRTVEGYAGGIGLGGSLKYYRIAFVGEHNILNTHDADKLALAYNAGELLAIAENTLEHVEQHDNFQVFRNDDHYTAVYFSENLDKFGDFSKQVLALNGSVSVYIFSWENDPFVEDFEGYENIQVKTIPEPILEIYRRIYNI